MILKYEIKKLLCQKKLIFFLIGLVIANIVSFAYFQNINMTIPNYAYVQFNRDIQNVSNNQRFDYIEKEYQRYNAFLLLENINQLSLNNQKSQNIIDDIYKDYPYITQYKAEFQKGYTLKYTSSLESEVGFLQSIYDEWKVLHGYPEYLKDVEEKAKTIQSISIFQNNDSDNIIKTAHDYQSLKNTPISYELEKGVKDAISFPLTSYFLMIGLFVICSSMILEEKEKRLFLLVKTTTKGQYQMIIAKCLTMMFVLGVMLVVMMCSQLFYMHMSTGLGTLTRSIQSLASYLYSPYQWNIIELIGVVTILKYIALCCMGLLMMSLMIVFQHKIYVMITMVSIIVIEFVLSLVISPLSSLYLLKYFNTITFMQPETLFQIYRNVSLGGTLISLSVFIFIVIIVLTITIFMVCTYVYCAQKEIQTKRFQLSWKRKPHISLSLFSQEIYKCLWIQKVGVILVLVCAVLDYQYSHLTIPQDMNILVYQDYMEVLEGPLTSDKELYIEKEIQNFESLHQKLLEIDQKYEQGLITPQQRINMSEPIENRLMYEHVFDQVLSQYERIQEDSNIEFVFSYPYEQILFETTWTFMPILMMCFVIIIVSSQIMTYEYQNQCHSLMKTTFKGNKYILKYKLLLSILLTIVIFMITQLPTTLLFMKTYGFSSLSSSAISIGCALPSWVSILMVWIAHILVQLFAMIVVVMVEHSLAIYTKNYHLSLIMTMLLFFVPMLLSYGDIHFLDSISLYPLLMNGLYVLENTKLMNLGCSLLGYGIIFMISIKYIYKKY